MVGGTYTWSYVNPKSSYTRCCRSVRRRVFYTLQQWEWTLLLLRTIRGPTVQIKKGSTTRGNKSVRSGSRYGPR